MRVLMLIPRYLPDIGGAEVQCHRLSRSLILAGVDVSVATYQTSRGLPSSEIIHGVPVRRIGVSSERWLWLNHVLMGKYLLAPRCEYDVLHVHGVGLHAAVGVMAAHGRKKRAIIKFTHSGIRNDFRVFRQQRSALVFRSTRRLVMSADRVVAICSLIEREAVNFGFPAKQVVRIPNGVETSRFVPATPELKLMRRRELGVPVGAKIVLTVGSLLAKKGIDHLLEGWGRVAQNVPKALLVCAGGSEERIRTLMSNRTRSNHVRMLPAPVDVLPWYQASDVFVLPSLGEGLSNALLEAQACGLPAVVTEVGCNSQVVRDGENGLVVPAADAGGLAWALASVLRDSQALKRMSAAARENATQFDIGRTKELLMNLYRELLQEERSTI